MRRYILFIGAFALATLSCSEDKGSYDYKEINEVQIAGLESSYSALYKVDTLRISPTLTFTQDDDPARYEYVWEVGATLGSTNVPTGTIGRERDLNYFVELDPGKYALYLKITDTKTGIRWISRNRIILDVRTLLNRGFLLLGEDEAGYAGLDMISLATDTVVIKGLLKDNGLPPLRNPRKIMFTGEYQASIGYDHLVQLWVMTDDGSYYLDLTTFQGKVENNLRKWIYTSFDIPDNIQPVNFLFRNVYYTNGSQNNYYVVTCDNGYAFILLFSQGAYGSPINRLNTNLNTLFKVSPYIFYAVKYPSYGYMFYDTDNCRFLYLGALLANSSLQQLADAPGEKFDWQQAPGTELLYGENTASTTGAQYGNSFALMRNAADEFFLYRFTVDNTAGIGYPSAVLKLDKYDIDPTIARNIEQATMFAFASTRTLMFYAVGNVLYAYDFNPGNERLHELTLDGEISMIKFDLYSNRTFNNFFVATYNPATKGALTKYILGTDPNTLDLQPVPGGRWDGLVKIVDMDWRNTTRVYE
jgi:hypothetical protein